MKFLKILGMVVALHVVLFTFFLLSPGCQSNPTPAAPSPTASEVTPPTSSLAATPVDENWSSQPSSSTSSASPAAAPSSVSNTISSAPIDSTPMDGGRAAPSRPDRPETYISTGNTEPAALNPPPTTHVIRAGDTLAKIAAKYGTTTSAIQKANPGVKPQSLRVGQSIKLPAGIASGSSAASSGAAASTNVGAKYTVRSGDSLSAIAARNGTTVTALRQANNIRGDTIQVGQELTIPGGGSTTAPASSYSPAPAAPAPSSSRISADASSTTFRHVLKSGETLGAIAKKYDVTVAEIMSANNIADARRVRAGQELVIPGYNGTGAAPASSSRSSTPRPAATTPAPATSAPASSTPPPASEPLPEPEPLIPADMTDAPPIPVDEPTPTP